MRLKLGLCVGSYLLLTGMRKLAKEQKWRDLLPDFGKVSLDVLVLHAQISTWKSSVHEVRRLSEAPIILLSERIHFVEHELKCLGVKAVVPYSATDSDIKKAVRLVSSGGSFIHPAVTVEAKKGLLSYREREVLALMASGKILKEIATTLFISQNTVECHVSSIRDKIGERNKADMVRYAIATGITQV